MKVNEFDFILPEELIAQSPLEKRALSKLLVLNKEDGSISHQNFFNIVNLLNQNDVLVINETKVLPARINGLKEKTFANIELLLLKELNKNHWQALVKPAKRIKVGDIVNFNDLLKAECIKDGIDGLKEFKLIYDGILIEVLEQIGTMPLPPYIKEELKEQERYQTVYAKDLGSAAAPTAGLHFTNDLINELKNKGVEIIEITLHVGLGTFRPVSVDDILDHNMHSETYEISDNARNRLNKAVSEGKRIVAVGTTSVRALESNFQNGKFTSGTYDTNIFIYPGYEFKAIHSLITNFHLPKSTLLMLVSAFSSKENIMNAYHEAINLKYRFFSFGDSMFIRGNTK